MWHLETTTVSGIEGALGMIKKKDKKTNQQDTGQFQPI